MAKSLKFLEAVIKKNEKGETIIENELGIFNLNDEINKFTDVSFVNFKLGKARAKGSGIGRKKTFKYECPNCGKKISSEEEDLKIVCKDCNKEYEQK